MPETVDRRILDLGDAARKLSIIGAWLKLRAIDSVDPAIRAQVDAGAALALGTDAEPPADPDLARLLVTIEMAFAEAGELLRNPARAPGWQVEDPHLLQSMGRASSNAFDRILSLAETRPLLRKALEGTFLDVGTGVGGIALRAAATCPGLQIDAIDLWEPALALAGQNIAESPHAPRIRLSDLDVTALPPGPRYTLVWLPTMFMARAIVERALDRIVDATRGDGWLVAAIYTRPDDPFTAAMTALRTLRGGGQITEASEMEHLLRSRGYVDVEVDAQPLATFILGRLP